MFSTPFGIVHDSTIPITLSHHGEEASLTATFLYFTQVSICCTYGLNSTNASGSAPTVSHQTQPL